MNKAELRKFVLERRKTLDAEYIKSKSKVICDKLFSMYPNKKMCVLAYCSVHNEVETKNILNYYSDVYLPVTEGDTISFYKYNGTLVKGKFGVSEPEQREPLAIKPDLIIIPGVGFDKMKNRAGYGKGYYDRFLKDYYDVPKVALAYSFQIAESIDDCYENDVKMDRIITDKDDVL